MSSDSEGSGDEQQPVTNGAKKPRMETTKVINPLLTIPDLGADDEVWLLQVPADLNADALHNQVMNFSKKSKVRYDIKGVRYASKVEKQKSKLPMLLPDESGNLHPMAVDCKGQVTLIESIEVPAIGEIKIPPKEYVQQPENFKVRHPFFGPVKIESHPELKVEKKVKKKKKKANKE